MTDAREEAERRWPHVEDDYRVGFVEGAAWQAQQSAIERHRELEREAFDRVMEACREYNLGKQRRAELEQSRKPWWKFLS